MNLHEYQAKQLFARYGMPAPTGYACTTPREAKKPHPKSAPARGWLNVRFMLAAAVKLAALKL
jgi:hypothetical protein